MSAILQLKKEIEILKQSINENKKLKEEVEILKIQIIKHNKQSISTTIHLKKEIEKLEYENKKLIIEIEVIYENEIYKIKNSDILQLKKEMEVIKTLHNDDILQLKKELEVIKTLHNDDILQLKKEMEILKESNKKLESNNKLKSNKKLEKDIYEIKRFIEISMRKKFNYSINTPTSSSNPVSIAIIYNHSRVDIDISSYPLFCYLNEDIMNHYLNNYRKNPMKDLRLYHRQQLDLNEYFKSNPIDWVYYKNYYKLEI